MKKKWFRVALMLVLVLCVPPLAMAAPAGKVTHTEGNVDITKAGASAARGLLPGESVEVGDTVRTKSRSKAEITFNDKNILRIAASSRITIQHYMMEGNDSSCIMKLHRGMAQAISAVNFIKQLATSPEKNKLEINTMNATCGIRGSNMIVSYHGGVTSVLFVTGHGYAYNPARPDVVVPITAGNIAFVEKKDTTPTQPRAFSDAERDTKVKAVTPGEKSQSDQGWKQDVKAESKDAKDRGKSGDIPGVGNAPTDAADLPSGLAVVPPGQARKVLDLKTADQTIRTINPNSSSAGRSSASQGVGGGASVQKRTSSSSSDTASQHLKEKKEKKKK